MSPTPNRQKTVPPRLHEDEGDYVFPERVVLDEEAFQEFSAEMAKPSPPTAALRALLER